MRIHPDGLIGQTVRIHKNDVIEERLGKIVGVAHGGTYSGPVLHNCQFWVITDEKLVSVSARDLIFPDTPLSI